jgi:four helix bundle protein
MAVRDYRDLTVWQAAMTLAEKCYEATKSFPKDELFGMTAQIRRASASIPANIAEGRGRQGTTEFLRFLSMARGSLTELETHLLLSHRVSLLQKSRLDDLLALSDEISRMLTALRRSLRAKQQEQTEEARGNRRGRIPRTEK